jgi:fructosamine-3-kinase
LESWVKEALLQAGCDAASIQDIDHVSGGDINEALYIKTGDCDYFVKSHKKMTSDFFTIEKESLEFIHLEAKIGTPETYGVFTVDTKDGKRSGLVMQWIASEARKNDCQERLANCIANLHRVTHTAFGYNKHTYIGTILQHNDWNENWCEFYASKRLLPQTELAVKSGKMPLKRRRMMDHLITRLHQWIPTTSVTPRLLHGDLWSGNWLSDSENKIYLIDPSILFGHREMEIAYTELFGGFNELFYSAYTEQLPLDQEYHSRKPLYQLFYLLVHLNTFGERYGAQIDDILNHYIGDQRSQNKIHF